MKALFNVEGMKCGGCAAKVEKKASSADGVYKASVDLASKTLTVEFDESKTTAARIAAEVSKTGFETSVK
ncbi:MAG: cation transporter [Clostridia bacterium]|nr:cation transporter [Clostridia bacterium]